MTTKRGSVSAADVTAQSEEPATDDQVPDQPESPGAPEAPSRPKGAWVELIERHSSSPDDDEIKALVNKQVDEVMGNHPVADRYRVLFLHDPTSMVRSDADKIYRALTASKSDKPILLLIDSLGGSISSAYFIAKLCREYSPNGFDVAVARRANTASSKCG